MFKAAFSSKKRRICEVTRICGYTAFCHAWADTWSDSCMWLYCIWPWADSWSDSWMWIYCIWTCMSRLMKRLMHAVIQWLMHVDILHLAMHEQTYEVNHACGYTAFCHEQTHEVTRVCGYIAFCHELTHEVNHACGYTAFCHEQTAQGYTVHHRSARPDILRRSPLLSVNIAWRMAKIHCATEESESTVSRKMRREGGGCGEGGLYK